MDPYNAGQENKYGYAPSHYNGVDRANFERGQRDKLDYEKLVAENLENLTKVEMSPEASSALGDFMPYLFLFIFVILPVCFILPKFWLSLPDSTRTVVLATPVILIVAFLLFRKYISPKLSSLIHKVSEPMLSQITKYKSKVLIDPQTGSYRFDVKKYLLIFLAASVLFGIWSVYNHFAKSASSFRDAVERSEAREAKVPK